MAAAVTLADFMDVLGHIVYFPDDDGLKNEIILKPQWLAKAIGYVLEDRTTNEQLGELDHARLKDIWYDHGIDGREQYPHEFHPFFLRLIEKHDVSYRLEDKQSSLVAQLVPNSRPEDLPWSSDDSVQDPQLTLICEMGEVPPGVIPWMIVRTHRFSTGRHWQRGMFLGYEPYGTALLELIDRDFQLEVRGDEPAHLMSLLQDSFEHLCKQRWPGLSYGLSVPCGKRQEDGSVCRGR